MPVNVPPTATGKRRFRLAVETDPHKLVNYCCGLNYHIDEPPIPLKPDNEYPDWLWTLRLGPKPASYELEKGTKEYYLRLAEENVEIQRKLKLSAPKTKKIVDKNLLKQQEYLHRIRFAALAHLEDDAGLPTNHQEDSLVATSGKLKARRYYMPVDEDEVLYLDKIPGNIQYKNYHREECTFNLERRNVNPRPKSERPATLDRKQRHRYSVM